jgi:hypothetical protein
MPITIGLIVAGGAIIGKTVHNAVQAKKAGDAADEIRSQLVKPHYEIDPRLTGMYTNIANEGAATEMPALASLRNRQINQSSAYLGDISTMAGGGSAAKIGALQSLYEKSIMPGEADMALQTSNYVENQKQLKQRNMMALLERIVAEKRFQYVENEKNPYNQGLAEASAMEQARIQHQENAWNTLISGGMMFAGNMGGMGGTGGPKSTNVTPSESYNASQSFVSPADQYKNQYNASVNNFANYGNPSYGSGMGNMFNSGYYQYD